MKNIAVFNNSTGVVGVLEALLIGDVHMINASTLEELLQLLKCENIHLILFDVDLDKIGLEYGLEMIQSIRKSTGVPLIVISSTIVKTAVIMSLNVGADDYVTSCDSPLVIAAKVKAQLRRYTELRTQNCDIVTQYRIGELVLDDKYHTVMVGDKKVKMTPIEYNILRLLISERGKVFSINQIYERIWQLQAVDAENVVAVHIHHVREKIESNPRNPQYLRVVRGLGYKVG